MTTKLMSRLAYETAREVLARRGDGIAEGEAEQPALRLKNLLTEEVEELLELWRAKAAVDQLDHVRVLIARDGGVACDDRFLSDPERSITWYRNNNESGLLYVQTKVESDEQGLESMFTVQDRNYLDRSLITRSFNPELRIVDIAWELAGGRPGTMPRQLPGLLSEVREHLQASRVNVSVRMFSAFASDVAAAVCREGDRPVDEPTLRRTIGLSLPALGLLPDPDWAADANRSRRLLINYRLADLMDPNGLDQDPEELVSRIQLTEFRDESGAAYDSLELETWRNTCQTFVSERSPEARRTLPFSIYRQVFSKTAVTGVPLGDRVREELRGRATDRLQEFDELAVQDGLNSREQDSARRLVEAVSSSDAGQAPLIDLLSSQTQKLLRKMAYPRDKVFADPFTLIVEVLRGFDADELASAELEIRCGRLPTQGGAPTGSLGLFAFFYGQTLREISETAGLDASGVRLTLDPELLATATPPPLRSSIAVDVDPELDEEVPGPVIWEGVPIELYLRTSEEKGAVLLEEMTNLRWLPADIDWLAFGWLMMSAEDTPGENPLLELPSGDFDALVGQVAARLAPINSTVSAVAVHSSTASVPLIAEALRLRSAFLQAAARDGVGVASLDEYVSQWSANLAAGRQEFVPNGVLDARLHALLSLDVIHSSADSRALMLVSHPLRLRWFSSYLGEVSRICVNALGLQLKLNSINEGYYLRALEQLSPHGQPPLLANSTRTLLVPVEEKGLCEVYAAIKREGQVTSLWKAELDTAALGEVAAQVEQYLRAHPHKSDGISLVFILPAGGSVPQQLVSLIRKGEWKDLPVRCHVLAPRSSWDAIVETFQELGTDNRIQGRSRHSPPLQLELIEWAGELDAARQLAELQFDIAVVPNFFGDKVDVNEYADSPDERAGSFHALYDDPTYVDREAAAGSVSIVLRPDVADPVLDDWSTANVRLLRSEAISPQSPECTDYVKLRIRFEEAGSLFAALHECSHWVITLDRYIGRDQIESLPQRPDVLTVREGVGQSGLSTLVVSSNAGKAFVVQRLGRKLERISQSIDGLDWRALAARVYDEIRDVAPGLILRSMGLSRVTEEVLGLMVAKRIAEQQLPPSGSAPIWISLDEHSDWFGGDNGVRADLCRVDLFREDGRLKVGILAVEGKLRLAYDPHGEQQAARTAQLMRDALQPAIDGEGATSADASFWRRSVLAAIRGASHEERHVGRASTGEPERLVLEEDAREELRSGEFDLAYCEALYSICLYDRHAPISFEEVNGVKVCRSAAREVLALIEGDAVLVRSGDPTPGGVPDVTFAREATEPERELNVEATGSGSPNVPAGPTATDAVSERPTIQADTICTTTSVDVAPLHGMTEQGMLQMYQVVLDTLAEFGVQVRSPDDGKPPYIEGPAFVQFRVKPERGVDPRKVSERESSLRLSLGLDEGKLLRFSIGGGTINIDVPKADSERYYVSSGALWERWSGPPEGALAVPIGVDQRGEVVDLDFSSANSPHLLIGGATGSGKSEALNTILHGLTRFYPPDQLRLVLIDPKQTELLAFERSPHLLGQIGFFDDDAIASLERAVEEMQRRYQTFRGRGARSLPEYNKLVDPAERLPWQVIVLDEYADLVSEPEVRREIESSVKRLSQKARACGIHVIIATQKPSAENISTTVRSNLPAQLALRCRGATESRIVMDEAGAETLNGKGDAFLKIADRLVRVQCALVS